MGEQDMAHAAILPRDRRGHVLHRADEVICRTCGPERFIVLGVGIDRPDEIFAVSEDDELVMLDAGMCEYMSSAAV